ncbi:MAG: DUF1549 domain-containing protein, partial [Planctomycetales bacterium]|nr:DUF1549 domain-containing protein [Planctomycetales bacterium]
MSARLPLAPGCRQTFGSSLTAALSLLFVTIVCASRLGAVEPAAAATAVESVTPGERSSGDVRPRDVIDAWIERRAAEAGEPLAPQATDAEFLRRVTLDLTGRVPSADEARRFPESQLPDKRERLVDGLLRSPEHARHWQVTLDNLLMQRRPAKHVDLASWRGYLHQSARENKPWDVLVVELLSANGADPQTRPAARFVLDRELKMEETVRDIGRILLGKDLQCAQCHDHPNVEDYLQRHYHGLSAFLNRAYLFQDPGTKLTSWGEKAEGEVKFTSVFTGVEGNVSPRVLNERELFDPPLEDPQGIYRVKPEKNARGVPTYSRMELLARELTRPQNESFRVNIANRLWASMMGAGIVDPVDMVHSAAANSHPELLQWLANDLADHGYDMQRTLREIALSRAYQRASQVDSASARPELLGAGPLKPLTPEQLAWSLMIATGVDAEARHAALAKLSPAPQPAAPAPPLESPELLWQLEADVNKSQQSI